jgi:hypothetical protein
VLVALLSLKMLFILDLSTLATGVDVASAPFDASDLDDPSADMEAAWSQFCKTVSDEIYG